MTPKPPFIEEEARWMKSLGQYIGCLAVTYVPLDANGDDDGTPMTDICSGFFIILDEHWFFVTAGHVFMNDKGVGLEQQIERKRIRIESAGILDYFAMEPSDDHRPTMIDYAAVLERTIYLNEKECRLDFAFLPLPDGTVRTIKGKGVKAFIEGNWENEAKAEQYRITGFPEEEQIPSSCTDTQVISYIRPVSVATEPCALPAGVPEPKYPYFAAKLLKGRLES
jgi:hypothetical protein